MPSYGQSVTLQYVAWDTANNVGKTGDVANHTLRWVKDGTSAAPTNTAAEVDSTNAPGLYKLVLTATEAQCQVGTLCGKSSTSGISILPVTASFENLPTALPAASGGLPTVGTSAGQINPSGGKLPATLASGDVTGNVAADVQTIKTQTVTCSGGVTIPAATLASTTNITGGTITTASAVTTVNDKTGYSLSASGLDSISMTAPSAQAANFREAMLMTWRRFFKKSAKTKGAVNTIVCYADDGSTTITSQVWTDDGAGNQTLANPS